MFKVSDYSVEKFNRFIDKLDKGNFLIKTNFKKSYSLILTRSYGGTETQSSTVASPTKDSNSDSNNNCSTSGGVEEGSGLTAGAERKKKGNLIKANSSTAIYHQKGSRSIDQSPPTPPEQQTDKKRKPTVTHDLNSIGDTGNRHQPEVLCSNGEPAEVERVNGKTTETCNNYNSKSLSFSYCDGVAVEDNNNDSDEFCRSEIFDNDSMVPESRPEFLVNDLRGDAAIEVGIGKQIRAKKMENNYENIRPFSSSTLSHYSRKHIRRKSNISYRNCHQEDNNDRAGLPKEEQGIVSTSSSNSNTDARSKSAIPTRFFKRQDYAQPELDFPSDYSESGGEARQPAGSKKRTPKLGTDLFHFSFSSRKKPEKVPQLKNINLNFPNKTTHFEEQQSSRPQPQFVLATAQCNKQERRYLSKAKTQILKLGQKCRLLGGSGSRDKRNHYISSYNLDDLIKATHKYEENEKSNLSNKIVYKSYKSELDLTKNLTYLDTFLNETFDNEPERPGEAVRKPSRFRHGHKRAKSCSKTLDQMLMTAATTTAPLLMPPQPNTNNARTTRTRNLIQLDEAWGGHKMANSIITSKTNKTKLASLIKMENDFSTVVGLDPDIRLAAAVGEKSAKSNTTSSSLSSSDYASVYSAPSSSAGGGNTTNSGGGNKMQNLKLICTPEGMLENHVEYSPSRHRSKAAKLSNRRAAAAAAAEEDDNLKLLAVDDSSSYYSLRANKFHQIHNDFSDGSIGLHQQDQNQDAEFHPNDFHNASTLQLHGSYHAEASSHRRQQQHQPVFRKQQNNQHHHRQRHHQHHHRRQSPLEADLTYQEDYLKHYQNTRTAALVGYNTALGCGASATNEGSNCDSSLGYFSNQSYHYGTAAVIDNESLRSNILAANELETEDDDDDDDDDDSVAPVDNDDGDDDDSSTVDGGRHPQNLGVVPAATARSRAHSFTKDFNQKDLLTSSRSFSRTAVKLSQADSNGSGTVNPGFLGPHRVIVSKSHKQRGELVLEYEC